MKPTLLYKIAATAWKRMMPTLSEESISRLSKAGIRPSFEQFLDRVSQKMLDKYKKIMESQNYKYKILRGGQITKRNIKDISALVEDISHDLANKEIKKDPNLLSNFVNSLWEQFSEVTGNSRRRLVNTISNSIKETHKKLHGAAPSSIEVAEIASEILSGEPIKDKHVPYVRDMIKKSIYRSLMSGIRTGSPSSITHPGSKKSIIILPSRKRYKNDIGFAMVSAHESLEGILKALGKDTAFFSHGSPNVIFAEKNIIDNIKRIYGKEVAEAIENQPEFRKFITSRMGNEYKAIQDKRSLQKALEMYPSKVDPDILSGTFTRIGPSWERIVRDIPSETKYQTAQKILKSLDPAKPERTELEMIENIKRAKRKELLEKRHLLPPKLP